MSKKKKKNSDYRYLQKKEDEKREAREREERKAARNKIRILNLAAFILIAGSLFAGVYAYSKQLTSWAPYYTITSGIGILFMAYTSKDTRPKFFKIGMGLGLGMFVLAYFIIKSL
ncbi:MAG: hypothetical protein IKS99_06315 [Firmicutes bacterium]|nr:hypothetical protein [Bacillota bacterium]